MSFLPAPSPAPKLAVPARGTRAPKPPAPPPPTPGEVETRLFLASMDAGCGVEFYRNASRNVVLPESVRFLSTVLAMKIARASRAEATATRFEVINMAREVLGNRTKTIDDVLGLWFAGDPIDLLKKKIGLMARLFSLKHLNETVLDLAWCNLSKSCPLNAGAIKVAEAWVEKLATERPSEVVFNSEVDKWWPDFNEA